MVHNQHNGATGERWAPTWPTLPHDLSGTHYDNAPIVEAIIDVSVEGPSCELRSFRKFTSRLEGWEGSQFGEVKTFAVPLDPESVSEAEPRAYVFKRADEARLIEVSPENIGFSWIGSYQTWDHLVSEFTLAWESYCELREPKAIIRLGARFVNQLTLPNPNAEISDYLRTRVDVAPMLPQTISDFFMQVQVPLDDELGVTITSGTARGDMGEPGSLALDLDTYDHTRLELYGEWRTALAKKLARLRLVKNYVFEASITDATRGLIQ